jgi:SAM-dependent methyltransferase
MPTVKEFYSGFSHKFLRDYAEGNRRIDRQLDFFARAVPATAARILVIGCGSGEGAHFLASRVAREASVFGVDLSHDALEAGRKLFAHPRLELREADVFEIEWDQPFDVIAFPDSLEHMPPDRRGDLIDRLKRWLAPGGRIVITVPTPAEQRAVIESGKDIQPIDEPIPLEALMEIARGVGGSVSYFNVISVWRANDYAHAVIERGSDELRPLSTEPHVPLKVGEAAGLGQRVGGKLKRRWRRRKLKGL